MSLVITSQFSPKKKEKPKSKWVTSKLVQTSGRLIHVLISIPNPNINTNPNVKSSDRDHGSWKDSAEEDREPGSQTSDVLQEENRSSQEG